MAGIGKKNSTAKISLGGIIGAIAGGAIGGLPGIFIGSAAGDAIQNGDSAEDILTKSVTKGVKLAAKPFTMPFETAKDVYDSVQKDPVSAAATLFGAPGITTGNALPIPGMGGGPLPSVKDVASDPKGTLQESAAEVLFGEPAQELGSAVGAGDVAKDIYNTPEVKGAILGTIGAIGTGVPGIVGTVAGGAYPAVEEAINAKEAELDAFPTGPAPIGDGGPSPSGPDFADPSPEMSAAQRLKRLRKLRAGFSSTIKTSQLGTQAPPLLSIPSLYSTGDKALLGQ
jgi:hypothetical protein